MRKLDWYKGISAYYEELTKDYFDYENIATALSSLLKGTSILEVGIGSASVAAVLARKGFSITGIDKSSELLKIAKQKTKGLEVKLVHNDLLHFRPRKRFDSAYSTASVFVLIETSNGPVIESYLPFRPRNKALNGLRNIRKSILDGGVYVFDEYPDHEPAKRFHQFGNYRYEFKLQAIDDMNDFTKTMIIKQGGKIVASSVDRKYRTSLEEFETLYRKAGFVDMKRRGGYVILRT